MTCGPCPRGASSIRDEPILEVTAPVAVAQLVETFLLNQITLHTTVASKAARYVLAAQGRDLVDFALRRTHGTEAAMAVARASAMVGFVATSNVEAARRYALPVAGTMAHSFIEAFPSEREAFEAFAQDHPNAHDLPGGHLRPPGRRPQRDRDDPGACDRRADRHAAGQRRPRSPRSRCERMLDEAGLPQAQVFASGGLDEHEVHELVRAGAPVDAFGIGTKLGVSADAPYVDSVYKLTEYDGRPVLKLSTAKATAPGRKQVWRSEGGDLIGLREEAAPRGAEPLLEPVMQGGRRVAPSPALEASRARFEHDLRTVPAKARRLSHPEHVHVPRSEALQALTARTRDDAMRRST